MRCEVGNHEADDLALLNIRQPNGALSAFGCIPCWKAAGRWCERHNRGHQGFADGTSACLQCIEEEAERSEAKGELFLQEILPRLPAEEAKEVRDWLGLVEELTRTSRARCFTRALATKALCKKISLEAVMQDTRRARSVAKLIPWPFGEWEGEGIPPLQ